MYPENPQGTQVIVGLMNMGYISNTARNRTHNLFHPKRKLIPLGHSDGQIPFRIWILDSGIAFRYNKVHFVCFVVDKLLGTQII